MPDATHHVFISHAAADKAVADRVCAALEETGVRCWIAPRNIVPGASWAKSILDAIASSKLMVLVFSAQTSTSPHVRREIERAVHRNIPIAPLRVEDVLPVGELEYFLSSQHWMDLFPGERDTHIAEVPGKICALLGIQPTPVKPPAPVMPATDPWGLEIKRETDDWQQPRTVRATPANPLVAPARPPDPVSQGTSRRWIGAAVVAVLLLALAVYGVLLLGSGSGNAGSAKIGGGSELVQPLPDSPPRGDPPAAAKPSSLELLRAAFEENRLSPDDYKRGQRLLRADNSALDEFDRQRRTAFEMFCAGTLTGAQLVEAVGRIDRDQRSHEAKLATDREAAQRREKVTTLLREAARAQTRENAEAALKKVDEALALDPGNAEGLKLRDSLRKLVQPRSITNSIGMTLVRIEPGRFQMGSPASEAERGADETQHEVTLTKAFYLGQTEVTQGQWKAVMGNNPSHFTGDDRLPVEQVSWDDAVAFCRRLSQKEGKNYRLPTEAEWEYACRAGTTTPFNTGDTISTGQANYDGNFTYGRGVKGEYRQKTTVVGSFAANAWGLYDMHGNVWEWCSDWYGDYPAGRVTDPTGALNGQWRVLRGGSWNNSPWNCRSAFRNWLTPDLRSSFVGFRVALDSP